MKREWIKDITRDLVALGSIPFFILVLVRVYLLDKPEYFGQFLVAGIILIVLAIFMKISLYSGLGFVILVFTNLYYQDTRFLIFSVIAYILLVVALFNIKDKKQGIIKGIFFGIITSGVSYYLVKYLFT